MSRVTFNHVNKSFGANQVLKDLDLVVEDGEFLVLLGPSGCGKTTALRILAGLEDVSGGQVFIGDTDVTTVEPRNRDIAMVFQSYALYPHMSVRKNVEFPLVNAKVAKADITARVDEALSTVSLLEYADRKPGQLSGGQRQRVALARAIVRRPKVFLMDEPLSNLDATLRQQTRADIASLQRSLGTTTIYVTHDQVEAMTMGTRIAVMNLGVLQQVGEPTELYRNPANSFVAAFLGNPGMNLVKGSVRSGQVLVGDAALAATSATDAAEITVGIRAEDLTVGDSGMKLDVVIVEDLGSEVHVVAQTTGGERVVIRQNHHHRVPRVGESILASLSGEVYLFDASTGKRIAA
jgi:ABC-type sugar transport system ATPase subunit